MASPSDRTIQATNDDATSSKAHAVKRGYWKDAYMHYFCPMPAHKSPEINRGYFVRTQAFKAITVSFIKSTNGNCQVVNLGAGSDTLYFQLHDSGTIPRKFVEVDLEHNVHRKISIIRKHKLLGDTEKHSVPETPSQGDSFVNPGTAVANSESNPMHSFLSTDHYCLFSFDLRLPVDNFIAQLCSPIAGADLDKSIPTLFLAECVLVYMPPPQCLQLLQGLPAHFPHSAFLHYEQVNMEDRFGSIMMDHFRARDCDLPGLSSCKSLMEQEKRFLNTGWLKAKAWTVNEVYRAFSTNTRSRIERVELLDDLEISYQLYDHYCILVAATDETLLSWSSLEEPLSIIP
ncbi:Leucine carboxyl methyltransferase 1 [Paragonimus heterotremus]|uniref:Leucine carboxyl methyltransferase 1 n=1 Tax=Paragonimus heterotremus TaxID=100268 RepID=A0A8J4SP54_9TREM|nr:Leucine carboxyl methyltransferase 1 [Paragonimus heterotremus]